MTNPPAHDPNAVTHAKARHWAWARLILGNLQMFVASVALVLLVLTGINRFTVVAAIVATVLTITSRAIWRDGFWPWKK